MSVATLCQDMDNLQGDDNRGLNNFRTVYLFKSLKLDNEIANIFALLSCKNKHVRSICIQKLTDIILDIDPGLFSKGELIKLYETGTIQLINAITKTKKNLSIFQPLIQLGIIFNCFIYLNAVDAKDDWIPRIRHVMSTMQSKTKGVLETNEQDIQVFARTVKCIFDLEKVDFDNSIILDEDMDDFLPDFSNEHLYIYNEGLAILFHTGNLVNIKIYFKQVNLIFQTFFVIFN